MQAQYEQYVAYCRMAGVAPRTYERYVEAVAALPAPVFFPAA